MRYFVHGVVVGTFVVAAVGTFATPPALPSQRASDPYFPPRDAWERHTPEAAGFDPVALAGAIAFAEARESERAFDFSDQERIFGSLLGSMPTRRGRTNGIVIHRGYVVAEFGDTHFVDPTYSVAKSMLATIAGVAVRDGKIGDLDEPVGSRILDGGYASPHNAKVTWRMHLQQQSEWEGEMWGKSHDFIGAAAFGASAREPRALAEPGTHYEYNDVRVNRMALSMLRVFGRPLPDVFQDEVMEPIGASSNWKWVPYHNSYVTIDGKRMASVSGGTRWGGGVWIDSWDLARFGYLWLRGGKWGDRQVIPSDYVKAALSPSAHGPNCGFLWWLNTDGQNFPGLPTNVFGARGAGGNTITISPDHDLVVVLRWQHGNEAEVVKRVIAALR
jgi:CubicO group peptidase (beta-lactamase class C family)